MSFQVLKVWNIVYENMKTPKFVGLQGLLFTTSHHKHRIISHWMTAAKKPGGGTRIARGGIRLVHGHTKSTLITYFSGMKIGPKYAFLHAFFLICPSCPFQNLSIWPKTHPFFNFARFYTPKRCTRIQCLVLKNNPNYVNFWTSMIPPLTFKWPPAGKKTWKMWIAQVYRE